MKPFLKIICSIFIIAMACIIAHGQFFYIANIDGTNIQVSERGDLSLGLSYPLENRKSFFFSYCPIKHISLTGSIFKYKARDKHYNLPTVETKGNSYTGAIGFYNYFKNPITSNFFVLKKLDGFLLQSYTGYSKNHIVNALDAGTFIGLYSQNYFFKWSLLLKYNRLSIGYSTKYIVLDFSNVDVIGAFPNQSIMLTRLHFYVEDYPRQEFTERTLSIQYRLKYFDFFFQAMSLDPSLVLSSNYTHYDEQFYSIGLIVDINDMYKGIKKKWTSSTKH